MRDVTLPKETVILKSCVASTMTCGHRMHVSHALMYSPPPNLSRQKQQVECFFHACSKWCWKSSQGSGADLCEFTVHALVMQMYRASKCHAGITQRNAGMHYNRQKQPMLIRKDRTLVLTRIRSPLKSTHNQCISHTHMVWPLSVQTQASLEPLDENVTACTPLFPCLHTGDWGSLVSLCVCMCIAIAKFTTYMPNQAFPNQWSMLSCTHFELLPITHPHVWDNFKSYKWSVP